MVVAASPFDRWRADHFSTQDLEETSISGEAADPDFDGISNIEEYSYRLDPWQPEPKPFIVRLVDGRLKVTLRKWMAATDVGLIAEGAASVVGPWHAGDVRVELSGAGPTGFHDGILQDQLASPRSRFLRWRWVRQ